MTIKATLYTCIRRINSIKAKSLQEGHKLLNPKAYQITFMHTKLLFQLILCFDVNILAARRNALHYADTKHKGENVQGKENCKKDETTHSF